MVYLVPTSRGFRRYHSTWVLGTQLVWPLLGAVKILRHLGWHHLLLRHTPCHQILLLLPILRLQLSAGMELLLLLTVLTSFVFLVSLLLH